MAYCNLVRSCCDTCGILSTEVRSLVAPALTSLTFPLLPFDRTLDDRECRVLLALAARSSIPAMLDLLTCPLAVLFVPDGVPGCASVLDGLRESQSLTGCWPCTSPFWPLPTRLAWTREGDGEPFLGGPSWLDATEEGGVNSSVARRANVSGEISLVDRFSRGSLEAWETFESCELRSSYALEDGAVRAVSCDPSAMADVLPVCREACRLSMVLTMSAMPSVSLTVPCK